MNGGSAVELSIDGSTINTVFSYYGSLFLMFFTASSGAVTGSRYMSSVTITQINSIGISSDYLVKLISIARFKFTFNKNTLKKFIYYKFKLNLLHLKNIHIWFWSSFF